MATKAIRPVKVSEAFPDAPDFDKLLEERKEIKDFTPIAPSTNATGLARAAELFRTDTEWDKSSDVGANQLQATRGLAEAQDSRAASTYAEGLDLANKIGQHNTNVGTAKRFDAEMAAAKRAAELAGQGKAKFGTRIAGYSSIDFGGFKIDPGSGEGGGGGGVVGNGSVPAGARIGFYDHNGRKGSMVLSQSQAANANKIIAIGRQRGQSMEDIQIALSVAMDESKLVNVKGGDRDSAGLFQQRPSQGWGSYSQVTNTTYSINKFYSALSKKGSTPWMRAQNTQRSAFRTGSNYKGTWDGAGKILSYAINPVGAKQNDSKEVIPKNFQSFIDKHKGQYTMENRSLGTQCVALYKRYLGYLGLNSKITVGGAAKNIWGHSYMDANFKRINRSGQAKIGDIAVFDGRTGGGYGHVGIVVKSTATTVTLFNSHAGNKRTDFTTLSKTALRGYYRR